MWTYILRRLVIMIPTLFGVTIVSFCIMQLAPGDPLLSKAGGGSAGQTSQTREAYLIQKRDLNLDKPLVLNFNYFRDYWQSVAAAAHYMALTEQQIAAELPSLKPESQARSESKPDAQAKSTQKMEQTSLARQASIAQATPEKISARRAFLESLNIPDFKKRLADPEQHAALAQAIQAHVQVFCENTGAHGVPAAVGILRSPDAELREKIGAIRCLNNMMPDPFRYTYSRQPSESETPAVVSTWRTWWDRQASKRPPLNTARRAELEKQLAALTAESSRTRMLDTIQKFHDDDVRFFAERLLDNSTWQEKVVCAMALRQLAGTPLATDVARDSRGKLVDLVAKNWLAWFEAHRAEFEPGVLRKTGYIFTDTQYAHMVWRLATFNFGRSAVKTREPVSEKIWSAVKVSAPLMVFAELLIYLVAVPLGILCAVRRNGLIDRGVSLGLFLLYSVPPFVAGMLFLLFLCYGEYLRWFPMMGLHSEAAEQFGFGTYILDYLHHICLPVVCLSLFSLANMAMYSRASMLDVISQDYIRTARAKGLSESKVIFKHAFRNALIPIITLFSSFLPAMLGGSVLIESIFSIQGMGWLSLDSILQRDYPTLMAMIYIDAILVMAGIFISDLLYVVVDPRISLESQGSSA